MKKFVRHIAMSLIAGLICLQGSVSAQESQSVYPGGQATMLSTGSVKMSTDLIPVSLPIRIDFSIDPNQTGNAAFRSDEGVISVISGNNLALHLMGIKAADGTSAKVVSPDQFSDSDWENLSAEQTVANIALGLKTSQGTIWSLPEAGNDMTQSCGAYDLNGYPLHRVYMDAKYGRAWPADMALDYIIYLRIVSQD